MPVIDIQDNFNSAEDSIDTSATRSYPITPSDNNNLPQTTKAIYVGTGGDVKLQLKHDTSPQTYKNIPSGSLLPIRAVKVWSVGTTADHLIAWF